MEPFNLLTVLCPLFVYSANGFFFPAGWNEAVTPVPGSSHHFTATPTPHDSWGCPSDGWISWRDKCYKLHTAAAEGAAIRKVREAAVVCTLEHATLAHVKTEEDLRFLSSLLLERYPRIHTWHIGGKRITRKWFWFSLVEKIKLRRRKRGRKRGNKRRQKFVVKKKAISENLWYTGGPALSDARPEPYPRKQRKYMTLSNKYRARSGKCLTTAQHHWRASWGSQKAGLNFICQRPGRLLNPVQNAAVCGQRQEEAPETEKAEKAEKTQKTQKRKQIHPKIYKGIPVTYGKHPWQVGIKSLKKDRDTGLQLQALPLCGGTIISDLWILSAGHCYQNVTLTDIRIVVGDHKLKTKDLGEAVYEVEKILIHKDFRGNYDGGDIALLKVRPRDGRGIVFSRYVQPACLPTPDMALPKDTTCWVTGWGSLGQEDPDELREAELPLISGHLCQLILPGLPPGMLCAGDMSPWGDGTRPCVGDSGGPLVCRYRGAATVVGITSWGMPCNSLGRRFLITERGLLLFTHPSVFTGVEAFLPWIESTVWRHSSSSSDKKKLSRRPDAE